MCSAESPNPGARWTMSCDSLEAIMKRGSHVVVLLFAALLAIGPSAKTASPQGKQEVPKQRNQQEPRDAEVKRLLLLMDTDKNGKISKKEWMTFMEAEFDRLDKDKTGELTPAELAQSRVQISTFARTGK